LLNGKILFYVTGAKKMMETNKAIVT